MTGTILDLPENGIVDTSITSKLRTDFVRIRKRTIPRLANLKDNEMKQSSGELSSRVQKNS